MSDYVVYVCDGCGRESKKEKLPVSLWDLKISRDGTQLKENPFQASFCNDKCLVRWIARLVEEESILKKPLCR